MARKLIGRLAIDEHLRDLRGAGETIAVNQASFLGKLVEPATSFDQLRWRVELRHTALVQDDDSIRINDGIDAVRNRDDGAVLEDTATQGTLKQCVRLYVDCGLEYCR